MDKNLPATLRRAADFLENVTNKQHAGFIHFPLWYVEAMQEAADELEKLQAELEDERYRHDRYVDYAVERDRMMDRMRGESHA